MAHDGDAKEAREVGLSDAVKSVGARARELSELLRGVLSAEPSSGEERSPKSSEPQPPNRIEGLRNDLLGTAAILEACQKYVQRELVQRL